VTEFLSLAPDRPPQNPYLKPEHNTRMLESFLTFLATLVSVRTNIGERVIYFFCRYQMK
jgi:hypothetical protein